MDKPLISVILPVYNIEEYLQKCMVSLFSQTYKNLEFVVVDDGSNSDCANLCDSLIAQDSRVVIYHKPNGGLSDARNYGISKATGDYITCVDPDDYVDCDYIEYLYGLLRNNDTKMSICQHRVVYPKKTKDYGSRKKEEVLEARECIERMLYHDVIDTSAWAKLYHKSLFENIKYPKGKQYEDIATTYKLFMYSEWIAVGYESKYNYVVRNDSIVNSSFSTKKLDLLEMTDKMAEEVVRNYPELEQAVNSRKVYARFSTLNQMIGVKGIEDERNQIIDYIREEGRAVLYNPKTPKRDKCAYFLLHANYKVYEIMWTIYKIYQWK